MPRLVCAFVDDPENAQAQSLRFAGSAHDHLLLDAPGAVGELSIWVTVEAPTEQPLRRLGLSLWAHGQEIDWITYEDAAVAPPEGWRAPTYMADHIFPIPAWLTFRDCVFEVRATSDRGPVGTACLTLELPLPF